MTRRITGSSQSTANKTPYVLPIGHLSTKSSVYSPVSMSRMSQDLVRNHMKSHYQRISSAKACVDTSAPKSMKLTMKEKDRKRKEALLVSNTQRPSSRSSSRQSNTATSNSPRVRNNNPTFSHISTKDTESSPSQQNERPCSTRRPTSQMFRENGDRKQMHYNQRLKDQAMLTNGRSYNNDYSDSFRHHMQNDNYERFERRKIDPTANFSGMQNSENEKISDTNNFKDSVRHHIDEYNNERYMRRKEANTKLSSGSAMNEKTNVTDTSPTSEEWSNLGTGRLENSLGEYRTTDRLYASTPRFEMGDEFEANPNLSLSTVSFSYKSSPTRRKPKKTNPEEIIWTEEQKYLQFISDVTNDVLARGICSNRVINKVCESHIEKRKDDLDEENMREMINQLKEDLGVTND